MSGCPFTMSNAMEVNIYFESTNKNSMNRVEWLMNKNLRSSTPWVNYLFIFFVFFSSKRLDAPSIIAPLGV